MSATPDSIFERIRKIKALADGGATPGEVNAAQQALQNLLNKHGLTMDDIQSSEITEHEFTVSTTHYKLWVHCVGKALGWPKDVNILSPRWGKGQKTTKYVMMTHRQFMDTITLFEFYQEAYEEELERFNTVFYNKHSLCRPLDDEEVGEVPKDLDKFMAMMNGMSDRANPLTTGRIGYESEATGGR